MSFAKHLANVHNTWNYVYYIVGLLEKDPNEYTGIESYIAMKYANSDIDWLPFQQTALLKKNTVNEDDTRDKRIQAIDDKLNVVINTLAALSKKIQN